MAVSMPVLRERLLRFRGWIITVLVATVLAVGARSRSGSREAAVPRPELPRLRMIEPETHWVTRGFVEMVPPIAPPTRANRSSRAVVWLKVPDGGMIELRDEPTLRRLAFPPGTEAARVESTREGEPSAGARFKIGDVRGTRLEPDGGQVFFVYRPEDHEGGPFSGVEWQRGDAAEESAAADAVVALVAPLRQGPGRDAALARVRRQNQCALCHVEARADNQRPRELGVVNRGTDASGFFVPRTVLSSEAPLEDYEPRNEALDSAYVTLRCAAGEPHVERSEPPRASCSDGSVPRARFDLARAIADGDERALKVCRSRRYLLERLAPDARAAFAREERECSR